MSLVTNGDYQPLCELRGMLVVVDSEMSAVLDSIGVTNTDTNYTGLVVEVAEAEFKSVFATQSSRPYLLTADYQLIYHAMR
jgi:hypothetical protein